MTLRSMWVLTGSNSHHNRVAYFGRSNTLVYRFIMYYEVCFISMKSQWNGINVQMWTTMNDWNNALGDLFSRKTFGTCYSLSNRILIESMTLKRIEIIQFTNLSFKFYSLNRVFENVEERLFAMLRSKIIDSPKESVECDWNNEYNLNN